MSTIGEKVQKLNKKRVNDSYIVIQGSTDNIFTRQGFDNYTEKHNTNLWRVHPGFFIWKFGLNKGLIIKEKEKQEKPVKWFLMLPHIFQPLEERNQCKVNKSHRGY